MKTIATVVECIGIATLVVFGVAAVVVVAYYVLPNYVLIIRR